MYLLKNFIFCIKLQTGGVIIGWLHLIFDILLFFFGVSLLTIYDCKDFEKFLDTSEDSICKFKRDYLAFGILTVITAISLAIFSSYNGIMAIKQGNYNRFDLFMKFLALFAILSMYDLLYFTVARTVAALFKGAINGYLFYVVYSLYITLRDALPVYKPTPEEEEDEQKLSAAVNVS